MRQLTIEDFNFSQVKENEMNIIKDMFLKNGKFRASRPKNGISAYVWRYIAFFTSKGGSLSCMPCTAMFWLWDQLEADNGGKLSHDERREKEKELQDLINRIKINPYKMPNAVRWGTALGIL